MRKVVFIAQVILQSGIKLDNISVRSIVQNITPLHFWLVQGWQKN